MCSWTTSTHVLVKFLNFVMQWSYDFLSQNSLKWFNLNFHAKNITRYARTFWWWHLTNCHPFHFWTHRFWTLEKSGGKRPPSSLWFTENCCNITQSSRPNLILKSEKNNAVLHKIYKIFSSSEQAREAYCHRRQQ